MRVYFNFTATFTTGKPVHGQVPVTGVVGGRPDRRDRNNALDAVKKDFPSAQTITLGTYYTAANQS